MVISDINHGYITINNTPLFSMVYHELLLYPQSKRRYCGIPFVMCSLLMLALRSLWQVGSQVSCGLPGICLAGCGMALLLGTIATWRGQWLRSHYISQNAKKDQVISFSLWQCHRHLFEPSEQHQSVPPESWATPLVPFIDALNQAFWGWR